MINRILQNLQTWGESLSDVLADTDIEDIKNEPLSEVAKAVETKPYPIKLLLASQEVAVMVTEENESLCRSVAKRVNEEFERLQTCYPEESSERLLAVLALTCALKPEKFNNEIEMHS